jgi:hypothetical protein
MRRAAIAAALAALWACGKEAPRTPRTPTATAAQRVDSAADVRILGAEVTHLLHLADDFRASHRGHAPRALHDLAIDSLTPTLARSVGGAPEFFAAATFRNPAGHAWVSCSGGFSVLEDGVLGAGRYTLTCVAPDGRSEQVEAGGAAE